MKVVAESLKDFKETKSLDEGLRDLVTKSIDYIKGKFIKIGKFFVSMLSPDKPVQSVLPVNLAIMYRDNMLPKSITVVPSKRDVELDPTLAGVRERAIQSIISRHKIEESEFIKNNEQLNEVFKKGTTSAEALKFLEHPNKEIKNINALQLEELIELQIENPTKAPLMIWGAPGIGKSEIITYALEHTTNGRFIEVATATMRPDDWSVPGILKDENDKPRWSDDLPKVDLPVYKLDRKNPENNARGNDDANDGEGGILFLDELSRAPQEVLSTCLKLLGKERTIGGNFKLGDKWAIVCAANRLADDESVTGITATAMDRCKQYNYVPDYLSWKVWALKAKVDKRILDFLEFHQHYFYKRNANDEDTMLITPRSWYNASEAIIEYINHEILKAKRATERNGVPVKPRPITSEQIELALDGAVGTTIATEFMTFMLLMNSYSNEDIEKIWNDPSKAPLPTKRGSDYDLAEVGALLAVLCSYSQQWKEIPPEKYSNFVDFLIRLDHGTSAVMGLMLMTQYHPYIKLEVGDYPGKDKYQKAVDKFIKHYGRIWEDPSVVKQ